MKIVYIHESIAHKGGLERIFVDKMNYLADRLQYEVYPDSYTHLTLPTT